MRLALLVLLATLPSVAAADLTVAAKPTDPPSELSEAIAKTLDGNGVIVTDSNGDTLLTLWFRQSIPVEATPAQIRNGLTYREIPAGTLIGVVQFTNTFTDYRKQSVPAGVYTLRFAVQPDVGDHIGTTPHPEFALLAPATADTDPSPLEGKKLLKLSSKITDGDHPAVMLLFPESGKVAGPRVADQGEGAWTVSLRRPVDADGVRSTLGFAITIAGSSKSR